MDDNNQPSNTSNDPVQPTPSTSPNPPEQPTEPVSSTESDQSVASSPTEQPVEPAPVEQPEQPAQTTPTEPSATSSEPAPAASPFGPPIDTASIQPDQPTQPVWNAAPTASGITIGSGGESFITSKKSKKPLAIGIVAALALIIIGGVLAYFFWYQNPDKVVADGFVHMVEAKQGTVNGTANIGNSDGSVAVTFDGGSSDQGGLANASIEVKSDTGALQGMDISAKGSAIFMKNGDLYFKVSNLEQSATAFVDEMIDSQAATYEQMGLGSMTNAQKTQAKQEAMKALQPVIDQIDNQWIKVSASDLNDEASKKTQQCLTNTFNMLETDKSVSNELADVYKKNKFVVVEKKLGSKDGSLGYQLKFDSDAAKQFAKKAQDTKFGKALKKCDDSTSSSSTNASDEIDSFKNVFSSEDTEVWIGRFNHQVTDISFDGTAKNKSDPDVQFDFKPDFTKAPSIAAPKDAKSFKDIENSLSALSGDTGSSLAL